MSATRNDSVGVKDTRRTYIDAKEAYKMGKRNLLRTEQRNNAKRNIRGNEILREIKNITGSSSVGERAIKILEHCYTKNGENDGHGMLPLNQMRYILGEEKDATYIIRVCALATLRVLSDMGKIPFQFWQQDAKRFGIEPNDINRAVGLIKRRLYLLYRAQKSPIDPRSGMKEARKNELYAFEQRLREFVRKNDVVGADELLQWVSDRLKLLEGDEQDCGPMAQENPRMLLAMITICGLEKFKKVKMTKKSIAEEIFLLSIGGVNARLKNKQSSTTKKKIVTDFDNETGVA